LAAANSPLGGAGEDAAVQLGCDEPLGRFAAVGRFDVRQQNGRQLHTDCFKIGPQAGTLGLRQFLFVSSRGMGLGEFLGEVLSLDLGGIQLLLET
jgi:hypothetical protein